MRCQFDLSGGLTLIELMVSIALSLLIISGLYHILTSFSLHDAWLNEALYIQQQGVALHAMMNRSLSLAGFSGCLSWNHRYSQDFPHIEINSSESVKYLNAKSDILTIRYWRPYIKTQVKAVKPFHLEIISDEKFKGGDVVIVHDCQHMQEFTLEKVHYQRNQIKLISKKPLSSEWFQPQIAQLMTEQWLLVETDRINSTGQPIWSLYQKTNQDQWQAIIDDVYYFQAFTKNPIHIDCILGSSQELTKQSKTIQFATGDSFIPPDRRFYQSWQLKKNIQ